MKPMKSECNQKIEICTVVCGQYLGIHQSYSLQKLSVVVFVSKMFVAIYNGFHVSLDACFLARTIDFFLLSASSLHDWF